MHFINNVECAQEVEFRCPHKSIVYCIRHEKINIKPNEHILKAIKWRYKHGKRDIYLTSANLQISSVGHR